jgi:hypothetical protein
METMLTDLPVPPVPDGDSGIAWLRSAVSRFANGAPHARRREQVVALLSTVDPASLRSRRDAEPVEVLAKAIGMPDVQAGDVATIARSYHPHTAVTAEADDAVERLRAAMPDVDAATRICVLVQAYDATARLIAAATPAVRAGASPEQAIEQVLRDDQPVRTTRRLLDGDVVEVDLAGLPFGAGPRACPGRDHAVALAAGALAAVAR